ncbi:MAG: PorT family protein [Bacteroidetes bacterium]|nr:PorT family protein [Bacteroidota bacterium]MBU1718096.1 PorT family protein [Bacteroidota bacterium]
MLKRVFTYSAFFMIAINAFGQRPVIPNLPYFDHKWIHFGFSLGLNKYDFTIKHEKNFTQFDSIFIIESVPEYGFNVGIIANLRLGEYWDFRFIPQLSFGDRNLEYTYRDQQDTIIGLKKIESTIVEFPFSFKYKSARLHNGRAYILGGVKYTYDMASQEKKKDYDKELVKIKRHDYSMELGFGLDFYFEYFKFSPEIKFSVGFKDLLDRDNPFYTDPIKRLTSKVLIFSFMFE